MAGTNSAATKNGNPTSISITALPRGGKAPAAVAATSGNDANGKPTFVICEVCDGYLKDLDQLRNHMSFIHKVGLVDFYWILNIFFLIYDFKKFIWKFRLAFSP